MFLQNSSIGIETRSRFIYFYASIKYAIIIQLRKKNLLRRSECFRNNVFQKYAKHNEFSITMGGGAADEVLH